MSKYSMSKTGVFHFPHVISGLMFDFPTLIFADLDISKTYKGLFSRSSRKSILKHALNRIYPEILFDKFCMLT